MNADIGLGIAIGVLIMPCLTLLDIAGTILVNAIKASKSDCTQDCNQGRKCDCDS